MRADGNIVLEKILEKAGLKLNWFEFSQDTDLMAGFCELSGEYFGSVKQPISKKRFEGFHCQCRS